MKAVIVLPGRKEPCIVRWTGRKGLKAAGITWCGQEGNAGEGVMQIPDSAKCCESCEAAIKATYK